MTEASGAAAIDLYWIPLGAGGHVVRWNGKVYEAVKALTQQRPRRDLYHTALEVWKDGVRYAIESAPIPDDRGIERGVVAEGAVGLRPLGRLRLFRYEIRCWPDGAIPDASEAVMSPVRVADDEATARRVLDLLPQVPLPVWGRDELETGDMWNSNSIVSWVLSRAGVALASVGPPPGGRAPGWDAGLTVARRHGPGTRRSPP